MKGCSGWKLQNEFQEIQINCGVLPSIKLCSLGEIANGYVGPADECERATECAISGIVQHCSPARLSCTCLFF